MKVTEITTQGQINYGVIGFKQITRHDLKQEFLKALRIPALNESVAQMKKVLKKAREHRKKYRSIETKVISADRKILKTLATQSSPN